MAQPNTPGKYPSGRMDYLTVDDSTGGTGGTVANTPGTYPSPRMDYLTVDDRTGGTGDTDDDLSDWDAPVEVDLSEPPVPRTVNNNNHVCMIILFNNDNLCK